MSRYVRSRLLGAAACVAIGAGGVLSACTPTAPAPSDRPSSQPSASQSASAAPGVPAQGAVLPADPQSWATGAVGDIVVPAPMRSLSADTYDSIEAASFNAGGRTSPRQVVTWLAQANSFWTWKRTHQGDRSWRLTGRRAGEEVAPTIDVIGTEAGVLVRVVTPST